MKHSSNIIKKHSYFFVGIGGIGMSSLARYFAQNNCIVAGYDRTSTSLTQRLVNENISITYNEVEAIEWLKQADPEQVSVIFTPAISKTSQLFQFLVAHSYPMMKRSELLGELTKNQLCLAVAGTHGKTTTTSILTHILKENEVGVTAFLGGILTKEQTNYISTGNDVFVVEADEFDRSFLHLHPTAAVITSTDADHLEIYGTAEALLESFEAFSHQVKAQVFTASEVHIPGQKIGFSETDDVYAQNIKVQQGIYLFDVFIQGRKFEDVKLNLPGKHNIFNALAAVALAGYFNPNKIQQFLASLSTFKGVQRRFNYLVREENLSIIDDYAHHPTEIAAAYQAATEMHPNENVMVIFQPHLYSRTQKFADEFAQSLALFDEIRLLEIYPAREEPMPGIDAHFLAQKIKNKSIQIIKKADIIEHIENSNCTVIALLGAGDIGVEAQKIKNHYSHELE